ncbi:MAG: hypothetical protein LBJ00_14580 [Planctomycetaceae bacterium]|nr:hypothetical protein [Planctomycetaceae bacterium]
MFIPKFENQFQLLSSDMQYVGVGMFNFGKSPYSGTFWESEPDLSVSASCNLSDNSAGTLTTESSKSLTGTITEEFHTTSSFEANYTTNIDAAGNETLVSGSSESNWH